MSYLLTNATALTALQNLTNTDNALSTTQNQLSTGLAIANASDNSSYWSIAQTMTSDNGALGAVNSSLAVNGSLVSTNTSALTQAISVVNNIKTELVAAQSLWRRPHGHRHVHRRQPGDPDDHRRGQFDQWPESAVRLFRHR